MTVKKLRDEEFRRLQEKYIRQGPADLEPVHGSRLAGSTPGNDSEGEI